MAIRAAALNKNLVRGEQALTVTWAGLTQASLDTGDISCFADYGDKTFQVIGTLGVAGSVLIEGSNDGVNFSPLSNRQGTAMSFTAIGMNTSQDKPMFVRPRVTAGDGTTSLTVIVACHRSDFSVIG